MNKKTFIKYIIIIIFILLIAFLSQQIYFWGTGKTLISEATNYASAYLAKGSNWVASKIYPKISEVSEAAQKRGDIIQTEVNQEKQKISENIGEKISNYFSGVANSVLHPGTPQNCQPSQNSISQ